MTVRVPCDKLRFNQQLAEMKVASGIELSKRSSINHHRACRPIKQQSDSLPTRTLRLPRVWIFHRNAEI